jgi:hypothetical protein
MVQPGLEPPEGEVSNFDNPNREMYYICIASNVIAIVVCSVFVVLRFFARYRLTTKVSLDDGESWNALSFTASSSLTIWFLQSRVCLDMYVRPCDPSATLLQRF